jgi:hypothetical protein
MIASIAHYWDTDMIEGKEFVARELYINMPYKQYDKYKIRTKKLVAEILADYSNSSVKFVQIPQNCIVEEKFVIVDRNDPYVPISLDSVSDIDNVIKKINVCGSLILNTVYHLKNLQEITMNHISNRTYNRNIPKNIKRIVIKSMNQYERIDSIRDFFLFAGFDIKEIDDVTWEMIRIDD